MAPTRIKYRLATCLFKMIILIFLPHESHGEPKEYKNIIEYSLTLKVEKNSIKTNIVNNSSKDIKLRKDSFPSSLLIRGINLSAYSDSEELKPIGLFIPIGSNSDLKIIPAGGELSGEININKLINNDCFLLKKNPIIIFWRYSAQTDEGILPAKEGAIRISDKDVSCD
ncbi:hypothetical protein [Delftia tsuruhatensis]|uniref:Uncharacterized protein n=1 Tax=Delftia tsuruhatensis TaxID=180282 RepID=A0AAX3SG82_9BURK|nr:hypothetical protein [Delftia tsuruhatensis]WFF79066.1 hypothetical protein PYR84_19220 [Delftia tsuruhatensis]